MEDTDKTKEQLIKELGKLRQRISELEAMESERKKVEKALKESEEKYRDLFENANDMIQSVDANGSFVYVNRKWSDTLGYSKDESKGLKLTDILREDQIPHCMEIFKRVYSGESVEKVETVFVTKGGSEIVVEGDANAQIKDGKFIATRGIFRNITERKKVEEALHESEEKWRSLTENTDDTIVIADNNNVIQYINRTIPPDTPEEVIGKTIYEYVSKEHHDVMRKTLKKVFKTGKPDSYEVTLDMSAINPKIGTLWFNTKVVPIKTDKGVSDVIMIATDITERKKSEEALNYFKKAVDGASDAIGMSTPEGKHYYQNEAFNRLFGLTVEEVEGEEGPPSTVYADEKVGREVFETIMRGDSWIGEVEMFDKNKRRMSILLRAYSIKDENGEVVGLIDVHTDITERKIMEDTVKRQKKFLEDIIMSLTHPFYVVDAEDYTIKMANSATFSGELPGNITCYALTHKKNKPCDSKEEPCPLEMVKKTKKPVKVEHVHFDSEGNARNVEVHVYPIFDVNGNVVQVIEYSLDITERKQATEAMQKSEASLTNAQRIAKLGNWDWDIENNELIWSDEIYRIFGLKPQEFGATYDAFLNYIHPDDRIFVQKSVDEALYEKKPYSIEHRIVLHDGTERIVHEQAEVTFDKDGKPIYMSGVVHDITEQKQLENDLKERIKELNGLYNLGKLTEKIEDYEELIIRFIKDIVPPSMQFPDKTFSKVELDKNKYLSFGKEDLCKSNICISTPIIIKGEKRGELYVGYTEDLPFIKEFEQNLINGYAERLGRIIEKIDVEKTLKESEERHRAISELASDYFYSIDLKPDGQVSLEWASGAFERVTTYSSDVIIDFVQWTSKIHPDDIDTVKRSFENLLANKPQITEYRLITKQGDARWLRDRQKPVWDEEKQRVAKILGTVEDITGRKKLEEERIKASKLEAINNMVVTINHEMNQPLSVICSNAEFLLNDVEKDSEIYKDLKIIKAEAWRLAELVKKTQQLQHIETTEYTKGTKMIDLDDVDPGIKTD